MVTAIGWVALVVLITANAVFVAAEFSLTSLDRARLDHLVADGDRRAGLVSQAVSRLSFELSAAQLGITACSLLLGFVAEPVVGDLLRPVAHAVGLPETAGDVVAVVVAVILATLGQMLFGELVPQNLAISYPLGVARAVVGLHRTWSRLSRPVVTVFDGAANAIVRSLGVTPRQELRAARSPIELRSVITSSVAEGTLGAQTAQLLRRALEFGTKTAGDVMTDRVQVEALPADATATDLIDNARRTGRSQFPVYGEDLDDVLGVVHVKEAFAIARERRADVAVRSLMAPPVRVPESLDCDAVLTRLTGGGQQLAVVVDEYGGTAGLVTVEDLIEELVGQIRDEHDLREVLEIAERGPQRWSVSGQVHKDTVAELLGVTAPAGPFDTVAGFVIDRLGRLPRTGDAVELDGWRLSVSRMRARRVDRIEIEPVGGASAQ